MNPLEQIAAVVAQHQLPAGDTHCGCGYALPIGPRVRIHADHVAAAVMATLELSQAGPVTHWCNLGCSENGCSIATVTFWRTPDVVTHRPTPTPGEVEAMRARFHSLPRP